MRIRSAGLTELVINAQQALQNRPGNRILRLAANFDPATKRMVLLVADNGPGFLPPISSAFSSRFFTTKPVGVGTGIGPSLCPQFDRAIMAAVSASAQRRKVAHCFGRTAAGSGSGLSGYHPNIRRHSLDSPRECILVVDDEPDIAELLAENTGRGRLSTLPAHMVVKRCSNRASSPLI